MNNHLLRALAAMAVCATLAQAHFIFALPDESGLKVNVILNEVLRPSLQVDIGIIAGTKLSLRSADGVETPLTLIKEEHTLTAHLPGKAAGTRLIHGIADLGLTTRGAPQPYILLYHPKTVLGDPFNAKAMAGGDVPVEIIPRGQAGAFSLEVLARGKPLAGAEVTVILPEGKEQKVKTDETGRTPSFAQSGRYGAWARSFEPASGERGGTKYEQVRHYATLVFDAPEAARATSYATLPQAASSFGAVASGGWLYVYGGHVSPTHSYFKEAVTGRFDRLSLSGTPVWETLPGGPSLQGMNLTAHAGKIYRIGGMAPHNERGKATDNRSTAECARFDPAAGKWETLPPLPEPRSSHDVVVVGDQLIVTGGWALAGASQHWPDTLAVLDLSAKTLAWRSEPQPFKRRALMAASHDGKMYVVGGIDDTEKIVRTVSIYNPRLNAWSEGPMLPEGKGLAFAPAAVVHNGSLYVSVSDGSLLRLSEASQRWESAGHSTARLAHRMVSSPSGVLVIGGAEGGKNFDLIEAVRTGR